MGRVRYGIKNLYYALATDDGTGKLTYETPVAVPGAKSVSFDAQGDTVSEYADNVLWYTSAANSGYSGDLVFEDTDAADTFLTAVLGLTKDSTTGAVFETAADSQKEFALLWQFELSGGEETGKRTVLYRCVASRPSLAGETKESGITVDTNTVTITAMPRISDDMVKASATSGATAYSTWFTNVVEKGTTTSGS